MEKDRTYRLCADSYQQRYIWSQVIPYHGIANSEQIAENCAAHNQGKSRLNVTRSLGKLVHGDLISHLTQFNNYVKNDNNCFYVYGRSVHGENVLHDLGLYQPVIRPSGNDIRHQYGIGSCTISIDTMATRDGARYEPGHQLTDQLRCPRTGYQPDQLFSITYPDKTWRHVVIEYERTYPDQRSDRANYVQTKSKDYYTKKFEKIINYIGKGEYQHHLKTKTGIICMMVFDHEDGRRKAMEVLAKMQDKCRFIAFYTVPRSSVPNDDGPFRPAGVWEHLWNGPGERVGYESFYLNQP